ncbi:MAG: zf-TFIIB domain-containing protein [Candidatus Thermoplasmatota archaeon]
MEAELEMEKEVVCPNCGTSMKQSLDTATDIYVCPECGCSIEGDEESDFDNFAVCPNCNQPLEGNECSYCGYDLGSDFE